MKDPELQKQIDEIPAAKPGLSGVKLSNCQRCGEWGPLHKVPWQEPETMTEGFGWLCKKCVETSESVKRMAIKYYGVVRGNTPDFSKEYNPVPKPAPKAKKGKKELPS